MDDKVFGLLEKLYVEMQDMKSNMATKQDLEELRYNMATKKEVTSVKHSIVSLENKMDSNFKALYDGYKQNSEGITEVKIKLDKLSDRVENQEIRLQVLKSAK